MAHRLLVLWGVLVMVDAIKHSPSAQVGGYYGLNAESRVIKITAHMSTSSGKQFLFKRRFHLRKGVGLVPALCTSLPAQYCGRSIVHSWVGDRLELLMVQGTGYRVGADNIAPNQNISVLSVYAFHDSNACIAINGKAQKWPPDPFNQPPPATILLTSAAVS